MCAQVPVCRPSVASPGRRDGDLLSGASWILDPQAEKHASGAPVGQRNESDACRERMRPIVQRANCPGPEQAAELTGRID